MILALTWDGCWTWRCGSESGTIRARDPLDACPEIRVLCARLRPAEVEVDGISETMHRTLAYLLGYAVGGE